LPHQVLACIAGVPCLCRTIAGSASVIAPA
jgi:hypothetical protein